MVAESVGLAASVAGLVSLGLQVTGGIVKYLDAFESRQDDLAFVKQQNEALRTSLQAIEEYVVAPGSSPEVAAAVSGSMQSFEGALDRIEKLYPELVDSGGKSWTSRLDNRRKRFTYPFNRSKVQQLGQQLEKARGTLQLTLNALEMRVSKQYHTETLATMEVSFRGLSSETQLIRSGLAAVEAPIVDIQDQLSTTHEAVNTFSQLLVSQYGAISYQAQENNQVFLGKLQETANLLQHLEERHSKQNQEIMKTIERLAEQTRHNYGPDHVPGALVRRLASKPALLKEASNAIQSLEHGQDEPVPLSVPTKPLSNAARVASKKKRRVVVGFNYTGLTRILKTAINMSFALTYGAGGFSISPSFTCNPTVDSRLDPAFRILDLLGEGSLRLENGLDTLITACMKRLIQLFDDGKVCPTAVDQRNRSLMHYAIPAFSSVHGLNTMGLSVELVRTLLAYGVAPFTYDLRATSPEILDILLRTGDLTLLEYRDVCYFTALEFAMIRSSDLCINGKRIQRCYDDTCNCLERDANDIEAINEEEAALLEILEDLVLWYEEKALDYLGTDSESSQGSFSDFWPMCWKVRVDEEVAKLHEMELKEAGERGTQENEIYRWGPQRPPPPVKVDNPYDEGDLEHWLYELDKICPEYRDSWPEEPCRVSEVP
ncbi:hypothetical protein KVR01_009510 [Diaporthe batatas]|uniref:uncharacterized protein n=1 Tax=Diaporthe batatas TaxID=748121 RepID=UPI001D0375F2|nr:uncharacterized protein KVR01_009510 [Diaporthe batatas]KAG8161246.1 hypothetical protein KVR01_009510 [Diaporthe batatas]